MIYMGTSKKLNFFEVPIRKKIAKSKGASKKCNL